MHFRFSWKNTSGEWVISLSLYSTKHGKKWCGVSPVSGRGLFFQKGFLHQPAKPQCFQPQVCYTQKSVWLLRVRIQVTVCDEPKLSYIAGEHGARSALPCPSLPLCHRNHSPADTPSQICKWSVPQTASCPKFRPAFSHSIQKTEALLELLGQSSFIALILAAIYPDESTFFKAEACISQHRTALPSVLHAVELK